MECLSELHEKYVIEPIDKDANNFAFICKKFYISRLLSELGVNGQPNTTYVRSDLSKSVLIERNKQFSSKFGITISEKQTELPAMYWIPKLHKSPVGARFIVASKHCSTKPLTEAISKVFKLIFSTINSFHEKSLFYSNYNRFWVVENSFPIIKKMDQINKKHNAKNISTFDFSTLYTKIPHHLLIEVISQLIDFIFKSKSTNSRIGFSNSSVYWTTKGKDNRFFSKTTLKECVSFLIENCFFTVGNMIFQQVIGIPMGIDPAPFWANLFLYHYENKFIQSLISTGSKRAFYYHSTMRFIDDLCAINDCHDFNKSFLEIYPPELELKVEHLGDHATFLDLDITIENSQFVYKLYDKRDTFPFSIIRMPHLDSNIPSQIFYGSILSEFLRIARCTLRIEDFLIRAKELYSRMTNQGGNRHCICKQIRKASVRHHEAFDKFECGIDDIICRIIS